MASSPDGISPTTAGPRSGARDGPNGFTAVNDRSATPPSASRQQPLRPLEDNSTSRPPIDRLFDRRAERSIINETVSPLNSPVKRKRGPGSEEDDSTVIVADSGRPDTDSHRIDYSRDAVERPDSMDSSEAQLVAALAKENGPNGYDKSDDASLVDDNGDDDSFVTTKAGVQVNTVKRKRAFTNRTKTGCQTCRRRKKKCDEQKPDCQNCVRGGFKCEGYSMQKTVPKPSPSSRNAHLPIQSKEGYGEPTSLFPRPSSRSDGSGRHSSNAYTIIPPPIVQQPQRPYTHDDGPRDPAHQWRNSAPYPPAQMPRHSTERRSMDSLPPFGSSGPAYDSMVFEPSHHDRQKTDPSLAPYGSGPASMAQRALSNIPRGTKSDKDRMIDGIDFCPFDKELLKDRDICRSNLDRFNTNISVSRDERERQLRAVLENPETLPASPFARPAPHLGKNVFVEAPFICDYGYNIYLMDNVIVERGCEIQDACEVIIGKGSYIGANVHIISKTVPYRPEDRFSTGMRLKGIKIHIGEGVYIGTGSKIVPDFEHKDGILTIKNGSYIKPFTVVKADVTPNAVWGMMERDAARNLGDTSYFHSLSTSGRM